MVLKGKSLQTVRNLIEIERNLNLRCDDIEDRLNHTVDLNSFEALKIRLNHVEDSIELKSKKLETVTGQILQLEGHLRKFKAETEKDLLAKELYDKKLNILIHGIDENIETAWETTTQTEKKIREFFNQAKFLFHMLLQLVTHIGCRSMLSKSREKESRVQLLSS